MIADGITDDTIAFQALLDDPATNVVDISAYKNILVTDKLTLSLTKTIVGARKSTKILFRQVSGTAAKPAFHVTANYCTLRSFDIDYDAGPGLTTGGAIVLFSGYLGVADDIEINGNAATQSAVISGIDGSVYGTVIKNCNVHDVTGQGISIINAIDAKVFNNRVLFPGLQGIVSQNIGYATSITGVSIRDNYVNVSNQAASGAMTGILVRGDTTYPTQGALVTGNTVIGTHGATNSGNGSISAIYSNGGIYTQNNTLNGGIGMSIGGHGNITGFNTVISPTFYGIEIGGSDSLVPSNTISGGNVCWQGIALQGDGGNANAILSGNIISGVTVPYFSNGAISNVLKYGNIPTL